MADQQDKPGILAEYAERYGLEVAIETGLWHGHGTVEKLPADVCPERIAIDISEDNCALAEPNYTYTYCGDSGQLLRLVLVMIDRPALFWLDAHWVEEFDGQTENPCPLLEELRAISKWEHAAASVVLIDDARLLGTERGYPVLPEVLEAGRLWNAAMPTDDILRLTPVP